MAPPLKRVLFFLFAVLLLRASPALSVPLATAVNGPGNASFGSSDYTQPSGAQVNAEGDAEGSEPRAGIVDAQQLAFGSASEKSETMAPHSELGMSSTASMSAGSSAHAPGWLMPAAAIGAGGGALFALASHGKHGNGGSIDLGPSGGQGPSYNLGGNGGTPGANPSDVPEPGTITLMGIGIASILGRRGFARK
jgi:hypothetical protein